MTLCFQRLHSAPSLPLQRRLARNDWLWHLPALAYHNRQAFKLSAIPLDAKNH